ncbi:sugar phosphate nucleotidyltransferase [Paenibacillus sacheonensis]|uniref:Cupin domain-containing protein n=1 Tax=Paenibacillus sacheonensis TaxID=742054 RepID=A0A7X5C017_9BACL|nr:sugar phosphate nucleotidyltransferase [Paenibacillus sacheonensis]MBM7563603.1 mannose-1-phosphate guanylyltransferase [Paenibacillus sacheonensis]NBC71101.1 cupin domain-containing protein [Paenibacillus sacheonensis]
MKIVLLSGGSGKRLWPLSNDSRSKQFLKILKNGDGKLESMIQRVWGQLEEADLQNHAYVATSKSQVEMIYSQLGSDINLIVEPERRDTFPAIALAATYLYSIESVNLNETIVVMPVDPYVEISFFQALKRLEHVLDHSDADLALMGVRPTYPSEKYGYIIPKEEAGDDRPFVDVHSFREKPVKEEAEAMIRQSALWNCGVFAFKLDFLITILIANELPIQYEEMLKRYDKLPKISFDYEVVERANRVAAVQYDGPWKDLGTWNTLTEEIETPLIGKGIITEGSLNTHVINELDIPITLMGLSDVIVAASPDGILVADKAASPQIKEVMKHSDQRPMYEERRWGRYRVLDYMRFPDGREVLTKRIFITSGKNLSYQYHSLRDEVWTVVAGNGDMILNEHRFSVKVGDVISIPKENKHSLRAETDIEIIEVQTGSQLIEEDIVRLELDWSEIVQLCRV